MWAGAVAEDVRAQKAPERGGSWYKGGCHPDDDGVDTHLPLSWWRPLEGQEGRSISSS